MSEHKTVRFKELFTHRHKYKPRFKQFAKLIVILLRAWRMHSDKVHEMLNIYQTLNLIADSSGSSTLLFDITEYKANKEAKTSTEVKRVLQKRPVDRTAEELHFVQVALRNYKSISEYPDHMQKGIATKAWYQEFAAKRVLVREGHVPMHFYFILSGSAVVTMMDLEANQERTVLFLGRGDSFGEDAIVNKINRPSTVISKQKIEVLVLTDQDYVNIFMSGGLSNINDAFLKGISCLDGWPRELLRDSPKKAVLNYFKRGTVMVKDSRENEWIIIVKSGSCNLLKKLRKVIPRQKKLTSTIEDWRERTVTSLKKEPYLSHEERLQLFYQQQISHLQKINQRMRFSTLPDFNVDTNPEYTEMRRFYSEDRPDSRSVKSATFLTRTSGQGHRQSQRRRSTGTSGPTVPVLPASILKKKAPFLIKSREGSPVESGENADPTSWNAGGRGVQRQLKHSVTKHSSASPNDSSVFINVQRLTKGSVFGITDLFYDDQPSFIVTSNGVECLLINKKFFLDHSSNDFIVKLRDETLPYPTEADLQRHLEEHVLWDHHKKQTVSRVIREIRARRPGLHFPREKKRTGFNF